MRTASPRLAVSWPRMLVLVSKAAMASPVVVVLVLTFALTTSSSPTQTDSSSRDPTSNGDKGGLQVVEDCPPRCKCSYRVIRMASAQSSGPLLVVNCSRLGLKEFPDYLPSKTQVLDMSGNRLQNLTTVPRLPELQLLDLSDNWLRRLDNQWLFEHVNKLRVLRLANNGLRDLKHGTFLGLDHLLKLDLSGNRLQRAQIHAFADLRRLEVFDLSDNALWEVKRSWFLAMPSLVELRLSNNALTRLPTDTLDRLPHLQHLDVSHNTLRSIEPATLTGLANLRLLNLSENTDLQDVPTQALARLPRPDILLLDGIGIRSLRHHAVSELRTMELSLSYLPELQAIGPTAFYKLPRLQILQIHDCPKLVFLHPEAFSDLPQLKHLMIHNNALVAVSASVPASLPQLVDIHLYKNPFTCDCNAFWLRKHLFNYGSTDVSGTSVNDTQSVGSTLKTISSKFSAPTRDATSQKGYSPQTYTTTTSIGGKSATTTSLNRPASFIREPHQITCFFPDGAFRSPLIQQPMQFFTETCTPKTLPIFPSHVNVSIGEPLDLECHGLGVPSPVLTWVLPNGTEIDASSHISYSKRQQEYISSFHPRSLTNVQSRGLQKRLLKESTDYSYDLSRLSVYDDGFLHISAVSMSDSGVYGCRTQTSAGQDVSTVSVHVQPMPLSLSGLTVSNDFITVGWQGSIPRSQLYEFTIIYKKVKSDKNPSTETKQYESSKKDEGGVINVFSDYNIVNLHRDSRAYTISNLEPLTRYELCLVYRSVHRLQCQFLTTTAQDTGTQVTRAGGGGIAVHVSRAQIGAGLGVALALFVVVWGVLVARRLRRRSRKDYTAYRDPLREDKAAIPLEGLRECPMTPTADVAPNTPLTSSRTALLPNSHI